jgi:hypothetical protein
MNSKIVTIHRRDSIIEDGILFVRTDGILEIMVKAPLILAGLIIVAIMMPIQTAFSSTKTLDLIIYSDGSTHVSTKINVDPLVPDFDIKLFGSSIDNFVAVDDTGFLLTADIAVDTAIIGTFGSSSITVDYDVYDLISKDGRVWIFSFDSPTDYTLLMPKNSVIVGMSALPKNMEIVNDQTKLELTSGPSEISYIFGASNQIISKPSISNEGLLDYVIIAIIAVLVATAISTVFVLKSKRSKSLPLIRETELDSKEQTKIKSIDPDTIFSLRPEMRDDDKEIIKFISNNGGQALESELRKKFLQPRTTMWRAVKRLERLGVVEIAKKDLQNMVILKKDLEEDK